MRFLFVLLLGALSAPYAWGAAADPPTAAVPAALDPASTARFRSALKRGRELEAKGDWKGAIVAFNDGLAIAPTDPSLLSELSWASYNVHDLTNAASYTQRAIKLAPTDAIKGAALYNLGLIDEARGDKPAAIADYRSSLQSRPSRVVRARLATFDLAAAAALDPFLADLGYERALHGRASTQLGIPPSGHR